MKPLAVEMSCWTGQDWHTCVFDSVVPQIGEPLFGLLVGGATIMTFYFGTGGRFASASVLTMLFAGVLVSTLPGGMRGVAWAVMFLGLVAALVSVAEKYVLNPGVN